MTTGNEAFLTSATELLDDIIIQEERLLHEVTETAAGFSEEGITLEGKRQLDLIADTTAALGELALAQAAKLRGMDIPVRQDAELSKGPDLPKDRDVRRAVEYILTLKPNEAFSAREAGLDPKILDKKHLAITSYFQQARGGVYFARVPYVKGLPRDLYALGELNPDQ